MYRGRSYYLIPGISDRNVYTAGNPAHATRTVQVDGLDPSVPMDWRWTLMALALAGILTMRGLGRNSA